MKKTAIHLKTPAFVIEKMEEKGKTFRMKGRPVEWFDEITIEKKEKPMILIRKTEGYSIPTNRENPVFRAAEALQKSKPGKRGVTILIKKNVPTRCGLNSQWSNAAGIVLALNKLWDLHLTGPDLKQVAEKVDPRLVWTLKHQYRNPQKKFLIAVIKPKNIVIQKKWAGSGSTAQKKIWAHFPDLKHIQGELLALGAAPAGLSGTGACVYGIFEKSVTKNAIRKKLLKKSEVIWVGKPCHGGREKV